MLPGRGKVVSVGQKGQLGNRNVNNGETETETSFVVRIGEFFKVEIFIFFLLNPNLDKWNLIFIYLDIKSQ